MTKLKEVYKCNICGNIVEVLHTGEGELVCCGQQMELLIEEREDVGEEKHVPVIEKLEEGGLRIKIGSLPHPMEKEHYMEWIEINTIDGKSGKKFLKPKDSPKADFYTKFEVKSVRAYCNIHGLWKKTV